MFKLFSRAPMNMVKRWGSSTDPCKTPVVTWVHYEDPYQDFLICVTAGMFTKQGKLLYHLFLFVFCVPRMFFFFKNQRINTGHHRFYSVVKGDRTEEIPWSDVKVSSLSMTKWEVPQTPKAISLKRKASRVDISQESAGIQADGNITTTKSLPSILPCELHKVWWGSCIRFSATCGCSYWKEKA